MPKQCKTANPLEFALIEKWAHNVDLMPWILSIWYLCMFKLFHNVDLVPSNRFCATDPTSIFGTKYPHASIFQLRGMYYILVCCLQNIFVLKLSYMSLIFTIPLFAICTQI